MNSIHAEALADSLAVHSSTLASLLTCQPFDAASLSQSSLLHAAHKHLALSIDHIDSCILLLRCLPDLPYESPGCYIA